MSIDFSVSDIVPAPPETVYRTWLDSEGHRLMTGNHAAHIAAFEGGAFVAWDGYVSGINLELQPGERIMQAWRTERFAENDPDSMVEIVFEAIAEGTRVTVRHWNIPDGHTSHETGWQTHYFDPMKQYFKSLHAKRPRASRTHDLRNAQE